MRRFDSLSPLLKKLFLKDRWFIGIRKRRDDVLAYDNTAGYLVLRPSRDRFYADPFLCKWQSTNYLFFEEYRYERGKGRIGVMTLDADGTPVSEAIALERLYHLSFPFVFDWAGEMWMIPETSGNRTIELYRARRFPEQWELEKVLMHSLNASDSIVVFHADKYWLFTSLENADAYHYNNLSLFYSDSLLGDWHPHPRNPIVTDTSRARPAGNIFANGNNLIRPGQDCAHGYGRAIRFNRIDVWDERHYQECAVSHVPSNWVANCVGAHTYNRNEDFEVLDGYTVDIDPYGKWLSLVGTAKHWLQG